MKFPYFADTTERGVRGMKGEGIGAEREGDLILTLIGFPPLDFKTFVLCFIILEYFSIF
jgi:hypothetical protein